jgi:hypothetical protein
MTEIEQLQNQVRELESVVLHQHSEIQNLLEATAGLATLIATLREAQSGHQRIFESMHALMVAKGLISASEAPETAVN